MIRVLCRRDNSFLCLQIADLHGVVSKALGFSKELKAGVDKFLTLRLKPEPGVWAEEGKETWHPKTAAEASNKKEIEAEVPPSFAAVASSPEGMEIRPPGLQIDLELAGIEVNSCILLAGLAFRDKQTSSFLPVILPSKAAVE